MVPSQQVHVGGSFAPPLSDALLDRYVELAAALPHTAVKAGVSKLLTLVKTWWALPEPVGTAQVPHPVRGTIVALSAEHAATLAESLPWPHELDGLADVFERIDAENERELRDAAHHLLWFARELSLGREPLTRDRVGL